MVKNKRGWVRIIEAVVAILLIIGIALIVIDKEYVEKIDISKEVYDVEVGILRELQIDSVMRANIFNIDNLPINSYDNDFSNEVNKRIQNKTPNYLECAAKLCEIDDECNIGIGMGERDVYAQSVVFFADADSSDPVYSPRKLNLFCWSKKDTIFTSNGRIIICHTPPPTDQTLILDPDALADHFGHGDYIGGCEGD